MLDLLSPFLGTFVEACVILLGVTITGILANPALARATAWATFWAAAFGLAVLVVTLENLTILALIAGQSDLVGLPFETFLIQLTGFAVIAGPCVWGLRRILGKGQRQ